MNSSLSINAPVSLLELTESKLGGGGEGGGGGGEGAGGSGGGEGGDGGGVGGGGGGSYM